MKAIDVIILVLAVVVVAGVAFSGFRRRKKGGGGCGCGCDGCNGCAHGSACNTKKQAEQMREEEKSPDARRTDRRI